MTSDMAAGTVAAATAVAAAGAYPVGTGGYPLGVSDDEDPRDDQRDDDEQQDRHERAEEIAGEVARDNPDPVTRREAIELELEDEGLSEEGESLGEHIE
jgi:hypothetical protein